MKITVTYKAFAPHEAIQSFEFPSWGLEKASHDKILAHVYRECNHVDDSEWIAGKTLRSMSVGDEVAIDGSVYLCEVVGWKKLENTISLEKALELIDSCVVKIRDGNYFRRPTYISTEQVIGNSGNPILTILWGDEREEFSIYVCEGGNTAVPRDGNKLFFIEENGEKVELHLFKEIAWLDN